MIASGGIRTGLDIAKAICLGADLCSIALPFMREAIKSEEDVIAYIEKLERELKIAMWLIGAKNIGELKNSKALVKID